MSSTSDAPVIRQRQVVSRRRRDGLIQYAKDVTSQNGEDGIIERLFQLLPFSDNRATTRFCVDVGAWDGVHLSNTHSLLVNHDSNNNNNNNTQNTTKWHGVLIEADPTRFQQLKALHEPLGNTCLNVAVSCMEEKKNQSNNNNNTSLVTLLRQVHTPRVIDFLCIDVDGSDYWLLHDLLQCDEFQISVICIEFNPTMPDDLVYIPSRSDVTRHGASLSALYELAVDHHDYVLVETTLYNAFFVRRELYQQYLLQDVPATTIEELHETTMGTHIYQLYDGTIKLHGCKKLLWHRVAMDERKIQVLKPEQRIFPFAPPPLTIENDKALRESAVDMKPYCSSGNNNNNNNNNNSNNDNANDDRTATLAEDKQACAAALMEQLKAHGFALVRGTGISSQQCRDALHATKSFLQDADESVRRSCLAKDRARRGYSPMCTENFASLIGQQGPNDLVRKFRVGPVMNDTTGSESSENAIDVALSSSSPSSSSSLLQPNAWPNDEVWNTHDASTFRSSVEAYYEQSCAASHAIVQAICDGIAADQPHLAEYVKGLSMKESIDHTSILTLLGYRIGTRHKRKQKEPLVAPHTDVGVITMLLFDGGDCATLQRADSTAADTVRTDDSQGKSTSTNWVDVDLPSVISDDPVFVVNIGDCLSELSNGSLPSTLHQVVPLEGAVPRNCLALFVGLDPNETLSLPNGEHMTYEEWRKRRIRRAQDVLRLHNEK